MSIGSILVGVAAALVVAAFVARPFRRMQAGDVDRAIESWVVQARAERHRAAEDRRSRGAKEQGSRRAEEPMAFCPQCGRRVGPEDRFCARCGRPLRGEEEE